MSICSVKTRQELDIFASSSLLFFAIMFAYGAALNAEVINCNTAMNAETQRYEQACSQLKIEKDSAAAEEHQEQTECSKLNPNAQQVIACNQAAQEKFRLKSIEIDKKQTDEDKLYQNNVLRINLECAPETKCTDCISCKSALETKRDAREIFQLRVEKNEATADEKKQGLDCTKLNPDSAQVQQCDAAASSALRSKIIDIDKKIADEGNLYQNNLTTITSQCASQKVSGSTWTDSYGEMHNINDRYIYVDAEGRKWAFPYYATTFDRWAMHSSQGATWVLDTREGSFHTTPVGGVAANYYLKSTCAVNSRFGTELK
jgi:hypothetical protein